ncbi:hypothetical protein AX774_g6110 [Zancudomyces culisetae]|uniref:Uncharacterized protein n=1 Tax=Zancudomyces culisetae TaxID=1213189 RepID=A0A1R1PHR0_ZANCU|nr:hypothetical protein AX774_g6110 [Zancudomyces culisetae]|eukprot:OMH80453.1 hypothetical protein AX774_g6110 [Zancudomyces culisetae]
MFQQLDSYLYLEIIRKQLQQPRQFSNNGRNPACNKSFDNLCILPIIAFSPKFAASITNSDLLYKNLNNTAITRSRIPLCNSPIISVRNIAAVSSRIQLHRSSTSAACAVLIWSGCVTNAPSSASAIANTSVNNRINSPLISTKSGFSSRLYVNASTYPIIIPCGSARSGFPNIGTNSRSFIGFIISASVTPNPFPICSKLLLIACRTFRFGLANSLLNIANIPINT